MIIPFEPETPSTRYHLLTQTVIPRPIAWVLSENDAEAAEPYNLAPFSFFNAMCSDPPLLVMSIGKKPDGGIKDTRRNLLSGRDFVVHIASLGQAEQVSQSAANLAYGDSEVLASQLTLEDFPNCPVPRIAEATVAYHCKFYDVHEIGPSQQAIIYAEVVQLYLDDRIATQKGGRYQVDATALNPLLRLGGAAYAEMGPVFQLQRPS